MVGRRLPHRPSLANNAGYRVLLRGAGKKKLYAIGFNRSPARRWVSERILARLPECLEVLVRHDKEGATTQACMIQPG